MKKILFISSIILMMCSSMSLSAQTDFLQFINSVDWNSSENDFVTKYSSQVKSRSHFYSDYYKTKTDYEIIGIFLGDKEGTSTVYVDSASLKLESLSFNFGKFEKSKNTLEDAKKFSNEMDNLLIPLFGEPDLHNDDLDNEYIKKMDRTWYKDDYIVEVNHTFFSDSRLYSLTVKGVKNKGNDFRVSKWGDSKTVVMQKEGKTDLSTIDDVYFFSDFVAGISCDVAYIFTKDKLTMAKYLFTPAHSNKNDFIKDFRELVNLMTEKYGKPDYNAPQWHNFLYKEDPDDYGFAVSLGHLSYNAGWLGQTTEIIVALHGENYQISLEIQYASKKYEGLRKNTNIQNKIKDL
ncbi:hypothetical protein [Peijinzhouia sedimentorum]